MRRLMLILLVVCCGCELVDDGTPLSNVENSYGVPDGVLWTAEHPMMNLPEFARCRNWGGGSCVLASTVSLLRWQGRDDLADTIRSRYSGGQSSVSLHAKLEAHQIRYASTTSGDVRFLEWAIRTRRGSGITYFPNHYINLVDLDQQYATLMDNNRPLQFIRVPREEFIRAWRGYGGWATTVVYSPAPPLPR